MEQVFTEHLNWHPPLERIRGSSSRLLDGIDVFLDFHWDPVIGHSQKTFTNYVSLGNYIRQKTKPGRHPALLLTCQTGKDEGCRTDHETHDIFVVNILRYKAIANNDAAGAYFAGLQGSPIINPSVLSEAETDGVIDSLGTPKSIGRWIGRHPDKMSSLWSEVGSLALENTETASLISELTKRMGKLSLGDLLCLEALLALPDFPAAALQTEDLRRRKLAVIEFEHELARGEWKEGDWQKFFMRQKWIFGHGLLYIFLGPLEKEAYVGGKDLTNTGGRVADFAVRSGAEHASFSALVEIKTPAAQLVGPIYRNHVHGMHDELSGGVSQIIGSCDEWNRGGSLQPQNQRRAFTEGWDTAQPRGILVAGHTKQLSDSEDKKRSFELFRRHIHGIEILTFDELLVRAQELVKFEHPEEHPPSNYPETMETAGDAEPGA